MLNQGRSPMAIKGIALTGALATLVAASSAHAVDLATAKKMADACEAKAAEEGWKMNVAVVDGGADLVLFRRMDGAFLGSIDIAQMKAQSSAMFPFPTRGLGEIAFGKEGQPGSTPGLAFAGAGGIPGG